MNTILSQIKLFLADFFIVTYHAYRSWVWQCIIRHALIFLLCSKSSNDDFWLPYLICTIFFYWCEKVCKDKHWSISIIFSYVMTVIMCLFFFNIGSTYLISHVSYERMTAFNIPAVIFAPIYSLVFIKAEELSGKLQLSHKTLYTIMTMTADIVTILSLIYFIVFYNLNF